MPDRQRAIGSTRALFNVDTNNEIVIDAATGGRTTFKNAGATTRRGAELTWDGRYRYGLRAHVALTYLRAEFADAFTTGSPPAVVPSGTRLPGVPSKQAYGELAWVPGGCVGLDTAIEVQYVDKLYVNDRNTDAAPAYAVAERARRVRAASRARRRGASSSASTTSSTATMSGSVIVGDTNGRFFEPAPGRNWFVGASVDVSRF